MSEICFIALPTDLVNAYRAGEPDANGQPAERYIAHEPGGPCRHCLEPIQVGEPFLVLAHRPFPERQPYAEVGPIFLHAEACPRGGNSADIPTFLGSPSYIVRGYNTENRIVYGSGGIIKTAEIPQAAQALFEDSRISFLHVRSATNNCFHCRIERT